MWEGYQLERTSTPLLLHYNDGTTWASYQIRKIAGCTCAGNARNVFPTHRLERKPLVSDPDMHHGTCVMHVPWCTCRDACRDRLPSVAGKTFPAFPAHAHQQFYVSGKRPIGVEDVFPISLTRIIVLGPISSRLVALKYKWRHSS